MTTDQQQEPEPQTPPPAPNSESKARAGNAEAASRRVQLREEEAKNANLAQRLASMQRREVETLIDNFDYGDRLHRASDLFELGGVDLEDVLNDDDEIDPERIKEALASLRETRPYLFQPDPLNEFGGSFLRQVTPAEAHRQATANLGDSDNLAGRALLEAIRIAP